MKISFDFPDELAEFFESSSKLLDWGFDTAENMFKHIFLEGIAHRLEHMAATQSLDQHRRFHKLIDEERAKCHPKELLAKEEFEEGLLEG
ncbi:MAG: hypothetical protein ACE5OZ_25570 [Candidatus Heimdallarchaeota archaeon]